MFEINEMVVAVVKVTEYSIIAVLLIRSAQFMNVIDLLSAPNIASVIVYYL